MNLSKGVKSFFEIEREQLGNEIAFDRQQLKILRKPKEYTIEQRQAAARDWLEKYSVFRGATAKHKKPIAESLVLFFDGQEGRLKNPKAIKEKFELLKLALRADAKILTKTGNIQSIDSLTSKALWLCYPHDAPIMDEYAERSLMVIARMMNFKIPEKETRYAHYVSLWFQAYKVVEPEIERLDLKAFHYKGRVFDKYLWWLGQSNYNDLIAKDE